MSESNYIKNARNYTNFYQILMKNKKVLYRTRLMDGLSVKGR